MQPPAAIEEVLEDDPTFAAVTGSPGDAFFRVLAAPNVASKRWAFEQYDQLVQGQTVVPPGSDAAIVRIEGSLRALALSVDGKGRYGVLDPYLESERCNGHFGSVASRHRTFKQTKEMAGNLSRPLTTEN